MGVFFEDGVVEEEEVPGRSADIFLCEMRWRRGRRRRRRERRRKRRRRKRKRKRRMKRRKGRLFDKRQ